MSQPETETPTRFIPPTPIVVCATLIAVSVIGALTLLAFYNKDASNIVSMLNLLFAVTGAGGGITALFYAGAAAHNSQRAAVQTNGGMETRIQNAVTAALDAREQRNQPPTP